MTKNQFVAQANYLKVRYPTSGLDEASVVKDLYEDFQKFPLEVFAECSKEYFEAGHQYLNWSTLMRNCKDKWLDQKQSKVKALPQSEKGISLSEYLDLIGVGSFEEAVFQKSQELYKKNDLPTPVMEYNKRFLGMSYEEAKVQGWRYGGALDIESQGDDNE